MKRTITLLLGAGVLTGLFVLGTVPKKGLGLGIVPSVQAGEGCTLATLQGDYLHTGGAQARIDQSDDPTFPRVFAGVETFDGEGNWSVRFTGSFGGEIRSQAEGSGTYTLNSDCTGTIHGRNDNWDLFVTRDGREGAIIRTDDGTIATRYIKKP